MVKVKGYSVQHEQDTRQELLYLIHYDTLLQNATAILLQNATEVYYKMRQIFYYKMRQFYYKMGQLLQNAAILLQNATVIKRCKFRCSETWPP